MSIVGYISRDMTGTTVQGTFPEGSPARLDVSRAKDISLNLERSEIESYERQGADLHIVLANGETLVLDSYFSYGAGGEKNLFLSADGQFIEVVLEDKADGMLFASYETLDISGKWSAYDDLVFLDVDRIEPVIAPLAAPLLGGFGAAGAAAAGVVGTAVVLNGDDNTPPGATAPTATVTSGTQSTGEVVNAAEHTAGPVITGTGEPGANLDVLINGVTKSTIVDADGNWSVTFDPADLPTGEYETPIVITTSDEDGNQNSYDDVLEVDTETAVSIDTGQAGGDDIVTAAEAAAGLTLTGVAEPGASVTVILAGVTREATVDENGNWSATFEAGSIASGEYNTTINVTSTDQAGNTASASSALTVDTVAGSVTLSSAPIEIDDIINATERADGVVINGTATPGLLVTVGLGSATNQVVADANGNWSTTFQASQIPQGESQLPITASIVDSVGNTASVSDTVALDTLVDPLTLNTTGIEGDNIVNATERSDGVMLNGTVEPGSTVQVQMGAVTKTAVVDASGNWTVNFAASDIATGTYDAAITVQATDAAGNTATTAHTLSIDTEVTPLTVEANQTADDVISTAERDAGVTLRGTVEQGSTVEVTVGGVTRAATVDAAGNWSANFAAADILEGDYTATATIVATDPAGNRQSLSETFTVDTEYTTPDVDSVTFSSGDVRRIGTEGVTDSYSVNSLESNGTVSAPAATIAQSPGFGTEFTFTTPVSDGTHLVISSEDAAGNASSTLVVLEDNATNSGTMDHAGLSQFNIDALNLDYASDVSLSLTEADIKALSGNSDTLTVHGGADDTLTVANAAPAGTQTVDGQLYNVYTVGTDGTTLLVDQDINVLI